jgi:RNA polymerase sigma-70 factor (ECF subfamily)
MSGIASTSDSVLLVSVARRDQQALAELYQRHSGSVFHVGLRVLSVRGLAEEVVQDIFTRLWQAPERFDPARGSLRSFLLAQGHNRAVDIVRSETARRRREDSDSHAATAAYVLEDEAVDAAVGREVRDAVETLSKAERDAISLAYFGGHSYREVASLLGVPVGTAKSRIRSGLARLRAALVDAGIDPFMVNTAMS